MKKRAVSFFLTLCLIAAMIPTITLQSHASVVASGTCGANATWMLDDQGVFTISGTGAMYDHDDWDSGAPWQDDLDILNNMETLIVKDGITHIGDYSFKRIGLDKISLPQSVTSIGEGAFEECNGLTEVLIPRGVTNIEIFEFSDCEDLTKITVEYGNQHYKSIDGVLYDISGSTLIQVPGNIGTTISVQDGVKKIADYAFYKCQKLTNIVLPDSLTEIGRSAFTGCDNLKKITIPKNVLTFGDGWIAGCNALESISVHPDNPNYKSIDGALYNSSVTRLVSVPATKTGVFTVPNTVKTIGAYAFGSCRNLTKIILPNSVTSIEEAAFADCWSLEEIAIPNGVTVIRESTFDSCGVKGVKITLPNSITNIESAFVYARLTEIIIPNKITSIESGTFAMCYYLTSVTIPSSVTTIEYNAFYSCDKIKDVYYSGTEEQWNAINISNDQDGKNCLLNATIHFEAEIPEYSESNSNSSTTDSQANTPSSGTDSKENLNIIANSYSELLSQKKYIPLVKEHADVYEYGEDNYKFALVDINQDGKNELILDEPHTVDWHTNFIFTLTNSGDVRFIDTMQSLYQVEYSKKHAALSIQIGHTYVDEGVRVRPTDYMKFSGTEIIHYQLDEYDNTFEDLRWMTLNEMLSSLNSNSSTTDSQGDLSSESNNPLTIYSDCVNLSISKGQNITLTAGNIVDDEFTDPSTITFTVGNTSILEVQKTGTKDSCRYVKFKGLTTGTTYVTFTDTKTGQSTQVPVTVYIGNQNTFTLSSVPTQNIEKYPTNFYNFNGLYMDSYSYKINNDKTAAVTFDIYNANYTYGVVEVYNQDGTMTDAVLIEKMTGNNTSIKEVLWDNTCHIIDDLKTGNMLSYRQKTGFSQKTHIEIEIPKNGYIKITNDPSVSFITSFVNSADILFTLGSLAGKVNKYDVSGPEFSKKLTTKLAKETLYAEFVKDGSQYPKNLLKNTTKTALFSGQSLGEFSKTVANNIDNLNLGQVITETAMGLGIGSIESVFKYFSGPIGMALDGIFAFGTITNIVCQHCQFTSSSGTGAICIQNQGGGIRSAQQITIESETNFEDDIALNVFSVELDSLNLDLIKSLSPDVYNKIKKGTTYTYNISLMKNGKEVQPDGKVTVYIPIPDELKNLGIFNVIKVYRTEEDGSMTEMNVDIKNDCLVFETDHFSLYTVVGYTTQTLFIIATVCVAVIAAAATVCIIVIKKRRKKEKKVS